MNVLFAPDAPADLSRRKFMLMGGAAVTAANSRWMSQVLDPPIRGPLPFPHLAPGTFTGTMPFDHLVIVMQENHSFDSYLGMLPVAGQPLADGFTFNRDGQPLNWNPVGDERMYVYPHRSCRGATMRGGQTWSDTHRQVNQGTMDGFAEVGPGSMGYYTPDDLPFYYSLASTFTLANRWFAAAPGPTYPNRRFLMAGTASGVVDTDLWTTLTYPPRGTIWDLLSAYDISWRNYFSDLPTSGIILGSILRHPTSYAGIGSFLREAAAGELPAVSLVDSAMGDGDANGSSEESPGDIHRGETFVSQIVHAVMNGPKWHRTLLIWLYDEHGGAYDHVPPPAALVPDDTPPDLRGKAGTYAMYGPRVPAVVVSPYSRPRAVTNVVHDHTSVLATIQRQWNLPALTKRDANAHTLADFLDTRMHFAEPPHLAPPRHCDGSSRPTMPPLPAETVPTNCVANS